MRCLRDVAMSMRLISTAERAVEGLHAQTKREVQRVPHHASALVSLSHRKSYLHQHMESRCSLEAFAARLATLPDARAVLRALGLQDHPAAAGARDPRASEAFEVVYRGDGYTKYRMPTPCLTLVQHAQQPQSAILLDAEENIHAIKREAVISHICERLRSDGTCYSLPLASGAFKSLQRVLSGAVVSEVGAGADAAEADASLPYLPSSKARLYGASGASEERCDALQATLADTVFFTVVDSALSRAVRTKVLCFVFRVVALPCIF